MKEKNCVIYARQSSTAGDFSDSVENQILNCKKLAEQQGIIVKGIFQDLNTSGKTYPEGSELIAENDGAFQAWFQQQTGNRKYRAGLGAVIAGIKDVDYILVDDMTRLYRPVTRSFLEAYINQILVSNNVQILSVKEGLINFSSFNNSLVQSLKNQINDDQIAKGKAKSKQQLKKMKDNGFICNGGGKAFGTFYDKNTKRIMIDAEKEQVILFIFNELKNGTPLNRIVREVNARFLSYFSGKSFYISSLRNIRKNPVYCGYMYNSDMELIENKRVERAIISFEDWMAVQPDPTHTIKKSKVNWLPFSGLLFCGNCGSSLVSQTENGKTFYYCREGAFHRHEQGCSGSRVNINLKHETAWNGLKNAIAPILVFSLFVEIDKVNQAKEDLELLEELKVELVNLKNNKKKIIGLVADGFIDDEEAKNQLVILNNKIKEVENRINGIRAITADDFTLHYQNFEKKIAGYKMIEGDVENLLYEQHLREVVKRIDVFTDYIKVETIYGVFNIPRLLVKNKRNFPKAEIFINGTSMDNLKVIIIYKAGYRSELFTNHRISIRTK